MRHHPVRVTWSNLQAARRRAAGSVGTYGSGVQRPAGPSQPGAADNRCSADDRSQDCRLGKASPIHRAERVVVEMHVLAGEWGVDREPAKGSVRRLGYSAGS